MSQGTATDYKVHQWLQEISDAGWVSLHYDDPLIGAINQNEISGGGYARQKAVFTVPANRAIWNTADIVWTGLLQGQITHWGIYDDHTLGNLTYSGRLPGIVSLLNGKGYRIGAGDFALSMA